MWKCDGVDVVEFGGFADGVFGGAIVVVGEWDSGLIVGVGVAVIAKAAWGSVAGAACGREG